MNAFLHTQENEVSQLKGQGEERVKQHFPLFSGECFRVHKNFFPCIVYSFLTYNM